MQLALWALAVLVIALAVIRQFPKNRINAAQWARYVS
jgi:hypothetical protein